LTSTRCLIYFGGKADYTSDTEAAAQTLPSILESKHRNKLAAELSSPTYGYTPAGKTKIEGKDEMKKRGVPSPNLADALCMTMMWQPPVAVVQAHNKPRRLA
jgi:hypothetical protein